MQYFGLGLLTGAAISAFLQETKEDKYNQDRIGLYYERRASTYEATDQWIQWRVQLRRQLFDRIDFKPGDRVLDVACGTGSNFKYILPRIGKTGRLVGTDFSQAMLDEAQVHVDQNNWENVSLIQSDAAQFRVDEEFDVVICTLGLVVIPGYEETMQRMWEHLKPGGVYGIADLCESQRWYMQPFNFVMNLTDATLITDTKRRPWEWLAARAEGYEYHDLLLGYLYSAIGRKPK